MPQSAKDSIQIVQDTTGVVITLYAGTNIEFDAYEQLVDETVSMYIREVADPAVICLSVDGPGLAVEVAEKLVNRYGVSAVVADENGGKFAAVQLGMHKLLQNPSVRYFAAVDQDGDHFASDLLDFVRTAEYIADAKQTNRVLVMGERASLHRPLGFLRGEQETLASAVLLDALHYHSAVSQQPLDLRFVRPIHRYPDFHAGYKLFSRRTAEDVFTTPPQLAGCSPEAYYRHAIEAVMLLEAVLGGATLATLTRRTFDEQPVSVFANFNLTQMTANLIIWPCKRLKVPPAFVMQWLDNHLPELLLGTIQPDGRDELLAIRRLVLQAFGVQDDQVDTNNIVRPRFL